ncbi:neuronal-specific septin-3 isoform X2 [Echinops telfairi]|uniref:Neuronal-specific septin-3 isoform X2 n=1 Tax=Echinops telfairi TaxID=9371 RepID=A0AC55D352_ECHTE|nr:neuronal-specific septin-3 isoform X2 [Echinops telfairi]
MDHSLAPATPEMQPPGAPGPGAAFSHGHLLGPSACPSRFREGVPQLIPVLRKTICLDAFPQSSIPQASSRPGRGSKVRSVAPQEMGNTPGATPGNTLVPKKFSTISLTLRQNSQTQAQDPQPSHWEEVPTPVSEAATGGGRRLPVPGSPHMSRVPWDRVHAQGRGSSGLAKPRKMPTVEKHVVSSHLALPFPSRSLGHSDSNLVGPRYSAPMTAHMPPRASPGRGKPRPRGIPKSQRHLQRATPTLAPAIAMELTTVDTAKAGAARHLATMATSRPGLAIGLDSLNPARLDLGSPLDVPALETTRGTAMDLTTEGIAKSSKSLNLTTAGTTKLGPAMSLIIGRKGSGILKAMAGPGKLDVTTASPGKDMATSDPVKLGSARNMAAVSRSLDLTRANTVELDQTMDFLVSDPSRQDTTMHSVGLVGPDPNTGETILDSVINVATSDKAIYPLMPGRITDLALDQTRADDAVTELTTLDLTSQVQGFPEAGTDAAMSELVPEPRPKPAVPMKPVSINSNLLGYIGIDTIIEQMRKKTMKTGFDFNIMVVVIEEGGVKMKLTVIDTPGFGDQINNENCWEPIEKYINEQYEKFLKEEVNIARKKRIPDTRVHCCLYFISPTGHSLRPLDLEFMRHLSKVVNIIPVIAKADTMTLEEKSEFKQRVRKELEVNGIEFYPQKEFDEDLEDKTENDKIRQESMPFAVVGSDKEYQVNGKRVLGRKTPWGIIEVENLNHCEFALLRDFVIRTHLQDLKEVTHNIHYETYRAKRLNDNGGLPPGEGLLGSVLPPVPATPCPTAD